MDKFNIKKINSAEEYRQYLSQHVGLIPARFRSIEKTSIDNETVTGSLKHCTLGNLNIFHMQISPYHLVRQPHKLMPEGIGPYLLTIPLTGIHEAICSHYTQRVKPGSALLIDSEALLDITNKEGCDHLVISFPRSSFVNSDEVIKKKGLFFNTKSGLGLLLQNLLEIFIINNLELSEQSSQKIAETVVCLLADIINLNHDYNIDNDYSYEDERPHGTIEQAKTFIEYNLPDPTLSLERVAKSINCSVRTLHRLFQTSEFGSVSNYIWTRRLACCAIELVDKNKQHLRITDIAYNWGFSSSAHFSRSFKQEYGMTPKTYKQSEPTNHP